MVKLTLIGRLSDGMPLAQTPTYMTEEDEAFSTFYRQQREIVLKEIGRGDIGSSRMTILMNRYCFHYLIGNGVCYITLCEVTYPRKLAFYFLEDLQRELEKLDINKLQSLPNPYSLKRFDYLIGNYTKRYLDTRTQVNLSKLNSNRQQLDIAAKEFPEVITDNQASVSYDRTKTDLSEKKFRIWRSKLLEVIALKWTPTTLLAIVFIILLWACISNEYD